MPDPRPRPLTVKQQRFVEEYLTDLDAWGAVALTGFPLQECSGNEKGFYVYLLIDAGNGEIFYVGKGTRKRYAHHVRDWANGKIESGPKALRISEAMESGGVLPVCFSDGLSSDSALALERALIEAIGIHRLANATPGVRSPSERAADMLGRIKPFEEWRSERPRSDVECEFFGKVVDELTKVVADEEGLCCQRVFMREYTL